jgi:hypothetical protein
VAHCPKPLQQSPEIGSKSVGRDQLNEKQETVFESGSARDMKNKKRKR